MCVSNLSCLLLTLVFPNTEYVPTGCSSLSALAANFDSLGWQHWKLTPRWVHFLMKRKLCCNLFLSGFMFSTFIFQTAVWGVGWIGQRKRGNKHKLGFHRMFSSVSLSLPTTVTISDTDIGNIMEFRNNTQWLDTLQTIFYIKPHISLNTHQQKLWFQKFNWN